VRHGRCLIVQEGEANTSKSASAVGIYLVICVEMEYKSTSMVERKSIWTVILGLDLGTGKPDVYLFYFCLLNVLCFVSG